jgi:hypothetical protein
MGKRNKSTPPLIVDTIHTIQTMIKSFCQLCNQTCLVTHLYNFATFIWLNFIALFCICYKEKPRVHHLDIRESRSPIYDHGQFSSKLKFRNGPLSLPKKNWNSKRRLRKCTQWMGGELIYFHDFLCTPKKFNLCMCFPVRTIFIHILLVIWSKLRCRRTSSDGFKYSSIPCIVHVQCSSFLTCHENVGWFMC